MKLQKLFIVPLIIILSACQANPARKAENTAPQNANKPEASQREKEAMPLQTEQTQSGPQKFPVMFQPGSEPYPKELAELGVQGELVISLFADANGKPHNIKLVESSRHPQLDQNALAVAQKTRFELQKRRSATDLEPIELNFSFYSHDLQTFGAKTCGQFLKEVDYFRKTFPDRAASEVFGYSVMAGIAIFQAEQTNPKSNLKGSTFEEDVAYCQANPQRLLMKRLFDVYGAKFTQL